MSAERLSRPALAALAWAAIGCAGCSGSTPAADAAADGTPDTQVDVDAAPAEPLVIGEFTVTPVAEGLELRHGERLLTRIDGVARKTFEPEVTMFGGFFKLRDRGADVHPLTLGPRAGDAFELREGDVEAGRLAFALTPEGQLAATLTRGDGVAAQGWVLTFACEPDARFWGFGEQYNFVDLRGREVPIWVEEQGVGRDEQPGMLTIGHLTNSYFPMPYFIDPAAGWGFLLTGSEYSLFDLREVDARRWTVEVWRAEGTGFKILPGPQPRDVVEQLTAEVGRPPAAPPEWAFSGVWLAAQGGTAAVEARVEAALAAQIPVSAVWVQDWVGARELFPGKFGVKYRWNHDEQLYPDLAGLIARLRKKGVRFLGYFNPFVLPEFEQHAEGAAQGYLVKDPDGNPYNFVIVSFRGGLLDVTNPAAGEWFKSYARKALDLGMAGWMADFGEWLPFDAQLHEGAAPEVHNRYPTEWHRLNREVLEERYPDGDFIMLTRSGFAGEQRVAQVVWAGDQEADYTETDGLPTVVTAALTAGLSGVPYFTHDVGGFSGGPRDRELLLRWAELGALSPVMRTHDGLAKLENHHFDSAADTLAAFSRLARIHAALSPYFAGLVPDAQQRGLPLIRHTALVDPAWPDALEANAQWMLGEDLVFAPVVAPGVDEVEVLLPEGEWEHLFTGEAYTGREKHRVAAPLGTPAVFVRTDRRNAEPLAAAIAAVRALR